MRFTYSWLNEHLAHNATTQEIDDALVSLGHEVESVYDPRAELNNFIVAEIIACIPHPDADKLQICTVFDGVQNYQVVCGAPNAKVGLKSAFAKIKTIIPSTGKALKPSKIRGIESQGMLCSATELNLGQESDGILELDGNVGAFLGDILDIDPVFELSITPNRGDCFSVRGIARELAAKGLGQLKPLPKVTHDQQFGEKFSLSRQAAKIYFGAYLTGISNVESPNWLKRRLISIGINPKSFLVDLTNYLAFDLGQPMHVFDAKKIGRQISIIHSKGKFLALDDKEYDLLENMPLIRDENKILALAGIMGGKDSGSDSETSEVFLEVALFDMQEISKAGQAVKINSDSRTRFERGINADLLPYAFDYAISLIKEYTGAKVEQIIRSQDPLPSPKIVELKRDDFKKICNFHFSSLELQKLGFEVNESNDTLHAKVPCWRHDIAIWQDLAEEIIRLNSYDKIQAISLPAKFIPPLPVAPSLVDFLTAQGGLQTLTYAFGKGGIGAEIKNPINQHFTHMRDSIWPNLLAAALYNMQHSIESGNLFEIGPIFSGNEQQNVLAVVLWGKSRHWQGDDRTNFWQMKNLLEKSLNFLGMKKYQTLVLGNDQLHPGQSIAFVQGKNVFAECGMIHPKISPELIAFGQIFLDKIPARNTKNSDYVHFDQPPVTRDFAFLLTKELTWEQINAAIAKLRDIPIQQISVFDLYEKDNQKSLAFSLTLQKSGVTFTDLEIEKYHQEIITTVEKLGATLR